MALFRDVFVDFVEEERFHAANCSQPSQPVSLASPQSMEKDKNSLLQGMIQCI